MLKLLTQGKHIQKAPLIVKIRINFNTSLD